MTEVAMPKEIVLIPVEELIYYARNARTHPTEQVDQIAASIKEFGFRDPIEVAGDKTIVAGHGRLLAAKKLGLTHVPCVVHGDMTKAQWRAYNLVANKTNDNSGWNPDLLNIEIEDLKLDFDFGSLGFSVEDLGTSLGDGGTKEGNIDDDEVPETAQNEFGVERGQIWQLGKHRLMCGDSTSREDVEKLMAGEKADMVFTDPPYGVSYADKNAFLNAISPAGRIQERIQNDHMKPDEMNEFWYPVLTNVHFATTDKASYYICSPQGGDLMMMMMMSIIRAGWQLKHMLIWVKNNHVLGRCDYNYKHEPILYGWKQDGTHVFHGNGRCKTSVWDFNKPMKNDLHPTMKPVELCEEAILNSSAAGERVIDFFLGSGSTLIASEKTNRSCVGMELSEHYCSVIIKRWQDFTGQEAKLIG